jgi:valyl-tRNA synthetase
VLSRLRQTIAEVDEQLDTYEFAKACETLYHFAWDDVCDWYLELSKPVLSAGGPAADATRRVLGEVLDSLLRLLHPVIPFVTDELWRALTHGESVMVAAWPTPDPTREDPAAEAEVAALQKIVTEVRRFRSDQGLKPGQRVATRLTGLDIAGIAGHEPLIRSLARLDAPGGDFAASATLTISGGVTVELDTRGAIDVAAERARLTKDLAATEKELNQCRAKLGNEAFLAKAPEPVVAKIRDRLATAEREHERLTAALAALTQG